MADDATLTIDLRDLERRSEEAFGGPSGPTTSMGVPRLNQQLQELITSVNVFREAVVARLRDRQGERASQDGQEQDGGGGRGALRGFAIGRLFGSLTGRLTGLLGSVGAFGIALGGLTLAVTGAIAAFKTLNNFLNERASRLAGELGGLSREINLESALREIQTFQLQQRRAQALGPSVAEQLRSAREAEFAWEELKFRLQTIYEPLLTKANTFLNDIKKDVAEGVSGILDWLRVQRAPQAALPQGGFGDLFDFFNSLPPASDVRTLPGDERRGPRPANPPAGPIGPPGAGPAGFDRFGNPL